uniref:replication initiation protein RepM n=2 Tax=unclassified Psychrobacter TaxID=196806 RepID=UPI001597D824|nr:replication initiation protein RepM [Psychrobacter sp.]QJS05081.1 replication protein, Rep3 superfamily [Psychrobacter sp.]
MSVSTIKNSKTDLVVKTHRLNTVIQNLSLSEIRLVQLGIIDAREKNEGLSSDKPLRITAKRYAEVFDTTIQTAYKMLLDAEENLFERRFSFIDEYDGNKVKTRWVSQVKYLKGQGAIEIIFTPAVVNEISRINGIENFFTKYTLNHIAALDSAYSVRLYELLSQWCEAKKTPILELQTFRGQLGLGVTDYTRMSDFKRRILDATVKEVNEKTDIKVSYEQVKEGRTIVGFKFKVLTKNKPRPTLGANKERDVNTADMFTVDGLNDNQLGRIARNPSFVADYNHIVSSTSPAGQDPKAWEFEMINRLKKDASQFKKRPIRDYLEY